MQMIAFLFIFSARKLMLNKFCTDIVDDSTKFEFIEASPNLSDLPTFHNPSISSFGVVPPGVHLPVARSLPLPSPVYRIISTLGSKIPSGHDFHAKSTHMFIAYRPTMEKLKSPSFRPLSLPKFQGRHPLNGLILLASDTMEDNDHKLDQTEPTVPPSLQLDDELKEEPTLLSGIRVPMFIPIPSKRPTTHSPDTTPGRVTVKWLGDDSGTYQDMNDSIAGVITSGLFGIPYTDADIGGFLFSGSPELLIRWTKMATFLYPFFRVNSFESIPAHELFLFGEPSVSISRKYLHLRQTLQSYWYTLHHVSHDTGVPMVRSLSMEFPTDAAGGRIDTQAMLESALLVSPALAEHQREVEVYVPEGRWFDFFRNDEVKVGQPRTAKFQYQFGLFPLPSATNLHFSILPLNDEMLMRGGSKGEESGEDGSGERWMGLLGCWECWRREDDENDSLDEYQTSEEKEEGTVVRERMAETRIQTVERAKQQLEAQIAREEEGRRGAKNEWDIPGEEEAEAE
ncbi:putative Maltase-glucoamylase [Blattamonas nauphoetae]|uniref:Maltase-glucoamylase n=1 Tax=Blattamonas nauphoetae TaxID=2049346 RepID=A0ABQ9WNX3_9EUKA|nr:putative Maltase-glucoamylase [Blattamonas nauphoetae]